MRKFLNSFLSFLVVFTCHAQTDSSKVVQLEGVYSSLPWVNVMGGLDQGFVYMDNLDLTGRFQLGKLLNIQNDLTLFVYALGNHGGKATDLMGDFQVASNIQAPKSWRVFELWLQQNFFNDNLSVLGGLYDLNSEFDVLKPGTLFINSSFGIGAEYAQSGPNGPSIFPVSSLGIRFAMSPHERLKLKAAILDGVPGDPRRPKSNEVTLSMDQGALIAVEASVLTGTGYVLASQELVRKTVTRRNKVGRQHEILTDDEVNLGGWYYTGRQQTMVDSLNSSGNWGAYVGIQKYIFKRYSESSYLSLFARFGVASNQFNRLGSAISGGFVFSEIFKGIQDYLGLAVSTGFNSNSFLKVSPQSTSSETVLEGTYSIQIADRLTLQPDVQYVIHPNTRSDIANPLSFALLVQFSI